MLRLRQIAIVAHHLEPVVESLQSTFGLEVAHRDPAVATFGLHNAVLPVGDQFLEVVAPLRDGTAGGRYLERRGGDGGYMVILQTDQQPVHRQRAMDLDIRFALQHDTATYRLLQLHPADTGGSFLEIDEQIDDVEAGAWEPAGPDWQRARRTEVVSGIAAARIQSPEPARLASRWAEILDRPVDAGLRDDAPVWTIQLDDAELRFVEPGDDRGEGLAAADLFGTSRPLAGTRAWGSIGGLGYTIV